MSFFIIQQFTAYFSHVLCFIYNVILKRPAITGVLTYAEQHCGVARAHFSDLFKQLYNPKRVVTLVSIAQLAPLIDSTGLIRVGGRLQSSFLIEETKHPYLLNKLSLIINYYHLIFLHSGSKLVISMLSKNFWIYLVVTLYIGLCFHAFLALDTRPNIQL